jgi:hypothetical protein
MSDSKEHKFRKTSNLSHSYRLHLEVGMLLFYNLALYDEDITKREKLMQMQLSLQYICNGICNEQGTHQQQCALLLHILVDEDGKFQMAVTREKEEGCLVMI